MQAVFEYRLPRLRERRDLLLAERRPDDLRAWVECEARWMFEQSRARRQQLHELRRRCSRSRAAPTCSRSSPTTSSRRRARTTRTSRRCSSTSSSRCAPTASGGRWRRWCTPPPTASGPARPGQPVLAVRGRARRRRRRHRRLPGGAGVGRDPRRAGAESVVTALPSTDRVAPPGSIDPLDLVRPDAVRRARLPRRRVDAAARRGAGGVVRARGLRAVLGDHQARRHPRRRVAAGALLERARADDRPEGRARPADRDGRHPRSAAPRPAAPGRHARASRRARSGRATTRSSASRSRCSTGSRRRGTAARSSTSSQHVAAPLPIAVIAWFLGVPRDDRELLFHWTNEVIGKDDPEFRRPGETPGPDDHAARASRCTRTSPSWSSGTGASRATTSSASSSPPRSTASRSPSCSSSRTAS